MRWFWNVAIPLLTALAWPTRGLRGPGPPSSPSPFTFIQAQAHCRSPRPWDPSCWAGAGAGASRVQDGAGLGWRGLSGLAWVGAGDCPELSPWPGHPRLCTPASGPQRRKGKHPGRPPRALRRAESRARPPGEGVASGGSSDSANQVKGLVVTLSSVEGQEARDFPWAWGLQRTCRSCWDVEAEDPRRQEVGAWARELVAARARDQGAVFFQWEPDRKRRQSRTRPASSAQGLGSCPALAQPPADSETGTAAGDPGRGFGAPRPCLQCPCARPQAACPTSTRW